MPTRIVLADDHALVRQGIKSLLENQGMQVVAEASDGQEAVRQAQAHNPDLVVMDIGMPTLNGMDAARELGRCCPKIRPILLTQHDEDQYVSEALDAGVKGYVLKSQVASDLLLAIQQVLKGQVYLSPGISGAVMMAYRTKAERPADRSGAAGAAANRRGKIHQGRGIPAGGQCKNRGISPFPADAEAGYS